MKILVTDKIVDEGIDILKGKGYEVDERFGSSASGPMMPLSFAPPPRSRVR